MLKSFVRMAIFFTALAPISCEYSSVKYPLSSNPIVGGDSFSDNDPLPTHLVLLKTTYLAQNGQSVEFSYCTGALIQNQFVLTAAHCVKFNQVISAQVVYPRASQFEDYNPRQVVVHADYSEASHSRNYENLSDIALIKLKNKAPAPYSPMAFLKDAELSSKKLSFRTAGFGEQNGLVLQKPSKSFELKHVILNTENYDSRLPYFDVLQNKRGVCFGDSGGPAVVQISGKTFIIGLAVDVLFDPQHAFEAGYDRCLEKSVYLNVQYFSDWINEHTTTCPGRGLASSPCMEAL